MLFCDNCFGELLKINRNFILTLSCIHVYSHPFESLLCCRHISNEIEAFVSLPNILVTTDNKKRGINY